MNVTAQSMAQMQTNASAQAAQASQGNQESKQAISADFETFLTMLSVQMKNQDPLNPQDSTEFATQLAQFSTVEQAVLTNDLLATLGAHLSGIGSQNLSSWVGMEARVAAPAHFSGSPIEVAPVPNAAADDAYLVVRDSAGDEVQRIAIDPKETALTWAGMDDSGAPFATDVYSFEVENYANDQLLDTVPADVYTHISEARIWADGVSLIGTGGVEFHSDNVIALREPS